MNTEIDRKIAVIFVADVVGYSKHMEKDENATIKSYNACEKILNKLLKKYKGSVFNTAGDSVLAEFPSAVNAVECGVDFQNEIKKRNQSDKTDVKLEFRLGINMGDVVKKDNNLIGDGVNIAARLEALAQPNGITISKSVYDFVVPKTKMNFNDLGIQKVKQNEFHAFDILLNDTQKRNLKTKPKISFPIILAITTVLFFVLLSLVTLNFFTSQVSDTAERGKSAKIQSETLGRTLLILPFETIGSNEFDYIADSLTNHLRSTLPSTILLNIIPRQKSQKIKENEISTEVLKDDFDVSYVLSGRISVAGDKFRVSLELLDIHKDAILMASSSEFLVSDMFSAQDSVEFDIRKEIQIKLTMGSALSSEYERYFPEKKRYKKILQLRVEENMIQPSKTYIEMENEYKRIFEADRENPYAAYLYAKSIRNTINFGESSNRKVDAIRIKNILDEATMANPNSSILYSFRPIIRDSFYNFYGFDLEDRAESKELLKKSIILDPENHDVLYWASKFYSRIGNQKLAAPLIEKALSIAPFGPDERKAFRCRVYLGAFDFIKAEEAARELISLDDKRSIFLGSMFIAFIEAKTNRMSEAKITFRKILDDTKITKQQAIAQFRRYFSDGDPYYTFEFYNVLESISI